MTAHHPMLRRDGAQGRAGSAARSAVARLRATAVLLVVACALNAHAGPEEGRQKAQVCAACHGADGNSPSPTVPSLAGQPRQFTVTALYMFREGRRKNAIMSPFAERLSNADFNDLAAWYSTLKLAPPTRKASPEVVAQGKAITEKNNCTACHTATLVGQQQMPRLAGQQEVYLLATLKMYRDNPSPGRDTLMSGPLKGMKDAELDNLAHYLAQQGK